MARGSPAKRAGTFALKDIVCCGGLGHGDEGAEIYHHASCAKLLNLRSVENQRSNHMNEMTRGHDAAWAAGVQYGGPFVEWRTVSGSGSAGAIPRGCEPVEVGTVRAASVRLGTSRAYTTAWRRVGPATTGTRAPSTGMAARGAARAPTSIRIVGAKTAVGTGTGRETKERDKGSRAGQASRASGVGAAQSAEQVGGHVDGARPARGCGGGEDGIGGASSRSTRRCELRGQTTHSASGMSFCPQTS
jgi:hypothetical protein